jgi:hypothetical protein
MVELEHHHIGFAADGATRVAKKLDDALLGGKSLTRIVSTVPLAIG